VLDRVTVDLGGPRIAPEGVLVSRARANTTSGAGPGRSPRTAIFGTAALSTELRGVAGRVAAGSTRFRPGNLPDQPAVQRDGLRLHAAVSVARSSRLWTSLIASPHFDVQRACLRRPIGPGPCLVGPPRPLFVSIQAGADPREVAERARAVRPTSYRPRSACARPDWDGRAGRRVPAKA
jgi:hypothetical protein